MKTTLSGLLALALALAGLAAPRPAYADTPLTVTFSHEAGFYAEPFDLALSAPEGAVVYYTLDGSPPKTSSKKYTQPIAVDAPKPAAPVARFDREKTSRVDVLSVSAMAVKGTEKSDVVTRSFVKGTDVFTRFSEETLVFALTSDPHGLYDYYDGIFVEGIDRERFRVDFFLKNGVWPEVGFDAGQENPASPANFNRSGDESERAVYVEMFDSAGTRHIAQRAGMRVKGGFSRAVDNQKSLELYARESYGDHNDFLYAFFPDEFTDDGQLIERYRRVRLRNGGSDRQAGFIRDELSQTLFRQAGHPDTQSHVPAAVFLNGEYYGVSWLKTPRTENHLARRYGGGDSDNVEIVSGGDNRFTPSWWEGNDRATKDLHEVCALAMKGFSGEAGAKRFEEFARRIDVDSLINYYAMQIFINNVDWPNHNIEMWRYFPTEEELADPDLHPVLRDGRWRFFSHDLESAWAMWDDDDRMVKEDTLKDILTGQNENRWNSSQSSAFLYAIVGYEPTKAQLTDAFVTITEGVFAADNIEKALDSLTARIENELNHALRMNLISPESGEYWPSIESIENSRAAIRRFARGRAAVIYKSLRANLGYK